ncbi:hypothetical protein KI688_012313 [Linnemannia hyalina]|uniref:Uncharacterized protein n=1 Tax=Linnemannia hyalina TaxID=64524 RepID=A0A9P7XUD8_9FUNG|nr:hypothetical protein KI688_012313 [Linnemannia hyalina]
MSDQQQQWFHSFIFKPCILKDEKPLNDITNTVLSSSPPRGSASPTVAGSPRLPAPLATPMIKKVSFVSEDSPHASAPAEPYHIDTYRFDMWQQWRRAVKVLNDLEPQLSNQYLVPEVHSQYYHHYERVCERERVFFAELSRLTVPSPGPPLHACPNLLAIQADRRDTQAAIDAAWNAFNTTQLAAWRSFQESQRASSDAYSKATEMWERQLKK